MITIFLNKTEIELLQMEDGTRNRGGFPEFCRALSVRLRDGSLEILDAEVDRIERYATGYGEGGWNQRMNRIFNRTLGKTWGQPPPQTQIKLL